jgi:hypothetical protein
MASILDQSKEIQYAYIAGLLDGEGYLDIYLHSCPTIRRDTKCGYKRYYRCIIANNNLTMLQTVRKMVGDKGSFYTHRRKDPEAAEGYTLRRWPNQIREILPKVMPYMIAKKELAELIIQSLNTITNIHNKKERTKELLRIDELFRLKVLEENNLKRQRRPKNEQSRILENIATGKVNTEYKNYKKATKKGIWFEKNAQPYPDLKELEKNASTASLDLKTGEWKTEQAIG